jgi:hypothetical protein
VRRVASLAPVAGRLTHLAAVLSARVLRQQPHVAIRAGECPIGRPHFRRRPETGLLSGLMYFFRVRVADLIGRSVASGIVRFVTPEIPEFLAALARDVLQSAVAVGLLEIDREYVVRYRHVAAHPLRAARGR